MARHLDLRHDRQEAGAGVGDDLADIVLRIEATVRPAVEPPLGRVLVLSTDERLTAPRAHLGETRVLLDLEAPPLGVGQVPVEAVELMERREIEVLLHELLRHEVTGHVEMDAAPREPGRVLDRNRGDAPYHTGRLGLPEDRWWEELPQCLEPVERARRTVRSNRDVRQAGVEPIAFVPEAGEGGVEAEGDDRRPPGRGAAYGEPQTGGREEIIARSEEQPSEIQSQSNLLC